MAVMATAPRAVPSAAMSPAVPVVQKYKIALCQLPVLSDKQRNLAAARANIQRAAADGARLVVLPEVWNCPFSLNNLLDYAEDIDGDNSPSISMLSELAALYKMTIVGGSVPERMASGELCNTCCVLGPDGEIKAKHRKLHLFDIDIPGDITYRESDTLAAGSEPTVVDTEVGKIGIGICHDIRFPELAMLYRSRGAHLICYPSAFNISTGELLWELMIRSRAADNQLGAIIATTGHDEATIYGEIDNSMIHSTRQNLPLEQQRCGDIYRMVDIKRP